MMELFVYNWYYNGSTINGHCIDNNSDYKLIQIKGYKPSCYVELSDEQLLYAYHYEPKVMVTSQDINTKKQFYKVYFKNMNNMYKFVSEFRYNVYMADIPQISIFLAENNIDYVGWVKTPNLIIDVKNMCIEPMLNINRYPMPKIMAFDIEVYSESTGMPKPYMLSDEIKMISVVFSDDKKYILHNTSELHHMNEIVFKDEVDLILGFFKLIETENPIIITGFNIYNFDFKYIVSRLQLRLLEIPNVSMNGQFQVDIIKVDWSSDAYGNNNYDRIVIGGRLIIDMFLYFKRMKLDKYSLDFVSKKFLNEGKSDMHFKEMMDAFKHRDKLKLQQVADYCIQDSMLVMKLFDKVQMWIDICELAKITRCNIEDIYTRGEQVKMISQCVKECITRNIVLQQSKKTEEFEYQGAYVIEPKRGVYDNCALMDFQSLYPSIIIAYNICPSTYIDNKFNNDCFQIKDHKFRKEPIGMLPCMIKNLLEERKIVKQEMKKTEDKSLYTVLNRRQNALKICANSVYGMMGFKNSKYFGHVQCAESVTMMGRIVLENVVTLIESNYDAKVLYGDSVTGDTPLLLQKNGKVYIETIQSIFDDDKKVTYPGFKLFDKTRRFEKEYSLTDYKIWTDLGWKEIRRVIRHKCNKKIYNILTHTGCVKVTEDHSLLDENIKIIKPSECNLETKLLNSYPTEFTNSCDLISEDRAIIYGFFYGDGSCGTTSGLKYSWAINNSDIELLNSLKILLQKEYLEYKPVIYDTLKSSGVYKLTVNKLKNMVKEYRGKFYEDKYKKVPNEVLNSSNKIIQCFFYGYWLSDGCRKDMETIGCTRFDNKGQIGSAGLYYLMKKLGYNVSINTRNDMLRMTVTIESQRKICNQIKKMKVVNTNLYDYVYDIETDSGRFQAGIGDIIVSNTDSCLITVDKNFTDVVSLSKKICEDVTSQLPYPMALIFESHCEKAILLAKKRYILVSNGNILYKGVITARRDYCKYAKNFYNNVIEMIAKGRDKKDILKYVDIMIFNLISGEFNINDLVITKSISKDLKEYKVNAPHVVFARRQSEMQITAGTRLEYVYVKGSNIQHEKMAFIEDVKSVHDIDGEYYIEKQIATQVDDILSLIGENNYIKHNWMIKCYQ